MHIGNKVKFLGCNEHQVRWGNNDEPFMLKTGDVYIIDNVIVKNWHTKVKLLDIDGYFNSVCFEVIDENIF